MSSFSGYKWAPLSKGNHEDERAMLFSETIDWVALASCASEYNQGKPCTFGAEIGRGGRHIVRIVTFDDGTCWITRLRMPCDDKDNIGANDLLQREVDCLQLLKDRSTVRVPTVFGYRASNDSKVSVPFMFMECLKGNSAMDLHFDFIPSEYKTKFFKELALSHVKISSLLFPKIGAIVKRNGTYAVGPLPKLGGPFDTAAEFFKAWAANAKFPRSDQEIKKLGGEHGNAIVESIAAFPDHIIKFADSIPITGPQTYPLLHPDWGHNNVVVDDEYNTLGVIDWENAISAPWEMIDVPLILQTIPVWMDAPRNYDAQGNHVDAHVRGKVADKKLYINAVIEAEKLQLVSSTRLSTILADKKIQDLAKAIRLYEEGKLGFYSNVVTCF